MKKLILGLFLGFGLSITTIGSTFECTVSSDASQNVGTCILLSSGNGDMCITMNLDGPSCNKTICIDCILPV